MLLTRYLLRQETLAIVLVTIVLTGAIWMSQSLKLLEAVVEGGAPIIVFFQMMLLVLPSFLAPILPIALFLGLLFTMQKLINDQEWIVMQSVGMSPWQLARPALAVTLAVFALHLFISMDLSAAAQRELRLQRRLIQTDYAGALLREGTFTAVGKNMTVYVRERNGSNLFKGIVIHDTRDPDKSITITAENGFLINDKGPPRLVIQHGTHQERNSETGEVSWLVFDQYVVDLTALSNAPDDTFIRAYERPMSELLNPPADVLAANPHAAQEFMAEANQRIAFPLYNIAFAMLALIAVLGGEFSRRGRLARYITFVFFVVLLQSASLAVSSFSSKDNMLIPLMYLVPVSVIAFGLIYLLSRAHGRRVFAPEHGL
jgi:lipopolysaccharide export system permease protein